MLGFIPTHMFVKIVVHKKNVRQTQVNLHYIIHWFYGKIFFKQYR